MSSSQLDLTVLPSVIFSRRLHEEAAIQSQWWRVKWEEVNTHVRAMSMSKESRVSSVNSRFNTKSVVSSKIGES